MTDTMVIDERDQHAAEQEFAGAILNDLRQDEEPNPEAPYGFTRDGKPRGKPGPKPGQRNRRKGAKSSPSRAAPASSSARKPPPGPDYAAGVRGILQMVAAPLAMFGMKEPALALDAVTITLHADNVAEGVAAGAMELPQLQAILDRAMMVGPWGIILSPCLAMVAQILANHGIIPAGVMGTLTREELLAHLQGLQMAA